MCTEIKGSFANPETFPNDLYYYCFFKNLNLKDLAIASRVCKHWNRMANLEVLWQELVKQDCPAFAKNETITWKALYRLNIDGAKPRKISYHGKGVICAWGKTVAIWTRTFPRGGYKRTCFETDHTGSINCFFVRGNSHETQFVTGSTDKTLKVWKKNAKDERLQLLQTLEGHNASVTALTKSSYELYSGSSDGEIRVWSPDYLAERKGAEQTIAAHTCAVTAIQIDRVLIPRVLFSGSKNGNIKVWKKVGVNLQLSQEVPGIHKDEITSFAYNATRSELYSSSKDKTVRVWKKNLYKMHCIFVIPAQECIFTDTLPYQRVNLLTASQDGTIKKWKRKNLADPEYHYWEQELAFKPMDDAPILSLAAKNDRLDQRIKVFFALTLSGIAKVEFPLYERRRPQVKRILQLNESPINAK